MKNIIFVIFIVISLPLLAENNIGSSLNFFFDSTLNPTVGLSCNSELECKAKCQNSESCQKPVSTCLGCIGAKSPYLNDFFNNVGELTTACHDQDFFSSQSEAIFKFVHMAPIFPITPYNPLGLKDLGLMLKFMSLCPTGTFEPIAIAFTDAVTHAIREIPLVKCGSSLFPLVRLGEDCTKKAEQIQTYINHEKEKQIQLESSSAEAISTGDLVPLKYDVLQFSEFAEAQYLSCSATSEPICQNICHSSLSCAIPLNNEITAKGIATFNNGQFTACKRERFSGEILFNYLTSNTSFSFNSLSLSQTFDLPITKTEFSDLSVINSILSNFTGVFKATSGPEENSFFISSAYQKRIDVKMKSFCDPNSSPFILGHDDQVERVFCRTGLNGYFVILANQNENCTEKAGRLSVSKEGVIDEAH